MIKHRSAHRCGIFAKKSLHFLVIELVVLFKWISQKTFCSYKKDSVFCSIQPAIIPINPDRGGSTSVWQEALSLDPIEWCLQRGAGAHGLDTGNDDGIRIQATDNPLLVQRTKEGGDRPKIGAEAGGTLYTSLTSGALYTMFTGSARARAPTRP